jgi:PhnB protein
MQFNTYLFFDGRCEEAFRYYEKHLGAKIEAMMPYGDSEHDTPIPDNWKGKIMHGRIQIADAVVLASDDRAGMYAKPQGFRLSLTAKTPAEADRVFAALADGGEINVPLRETFFSPRFGMLIDRFGIRWMVNCEPKS